MGDQAGRFGEGGESPPGKVCNGSGTTFVAVEFCKAKEGAADTTSPLVRYLVRVTGIRYHWSILGKGSEIVKTEERMAKACRLIFAACGTSWHSGLIGKYAATSV